jgi:CheY-like chemotaxis protein
MTQSTILLIEDDPDVADTLRGLLRAFGYQVELAIDGNHGLRALRSGLRPNLILLDLMMPNMDGHRFREIQRDDPELEKIPTMVITADARASAEKLGVAACFRKPFDPERLLDAIKQHC